MSFPTPKRKRHMPQPNLNQDIITEILKRLSVKSLLQFRCVSKAWRDLISSPEFVKLHLHFQSKKDNKVMTYSSANWISSYMSLFSITENKQSSFRKFITYDGLVLIPEGGFELLGSCNGLLCFRAKPYRIIIWNPSSNGNIKTIPDVWQLGNISIFGFGYDECNDDYKVVYAYYDGNGDETVVLVYSFKHGSWKRSERGFISGFVHPRIAVFVSGNLNWCNNNLHESEWNWDIIYFNLTTETAKPMALPSHEHAAAICISESRGLLFAGFHHKHQMEVWVMNEYGVEESWTKLVRISNLPVHHPVSRGFENTTYMAICNSKLAIAHVSKNGDILMMVGHQLKLHRPNAKGGKNFNIPFGLGYMVTSYVETLVSPAMIGL
ncbi:PREDICTED: F-box/kelch-repeat protein At3g23880-like [Ipomoea nil]|uniref:F-box/kelch-repeat protein At3g23880-like n=1 Tax=Ipomoea nil TaxID=35883 RepID=UPI0009018AF1|nr:PREDICTED: F-box/kelch-repeat protein At3g23880-like [Ipomoea nil]